MEKVEGLLDRRRDGFKWGKRAKVKVDDIDDVVVDVVVV
jgi:hypothetical protein